MDKFIMIIVILIVLAAFGLIAGQIISAGDPKPADKTGRTLLPDVWNTRSRSGSTIASHAPVVYFQVPGEAKAGMVQLRYARTVIGSGKSCDIVLDHPSISRRHAEIYLAIRRQYIFSGKKVRFFVLRNLSKTNPVEFYDPDAEEETPFRMITGSVPLKNEENFFYLGDVKVKVINEQENHEAETIVRKEYQQKMRRSKATSRLL